MLGFLSCRAMSIFPFVLFQVLCTHGRDHCWCHSSLVPVSCSCCVQLTIMCKVQPCCISLDCLGCCCFPHVVVRTIAVAVTSGTYTDQVHSQTGHMANKCRMLHLTVRSQVCANVVCLQHMAHSTDVCVCACAVPLAFFHSLAAMGTHSCCSGNCVHGLHY